MSDPTITLLLDRLVAASVAGALAVGMLWAVLRVVPSISARARCWLWWLAAVKFLVILAAGPVVSLPLLPAEGVETGDDPIPMRSKSTGGREPTFAGTSVSESTVTGNPSNEVDARSTRHASATSLPAILVLIWMFGSGALLVRLAAFTWRDHRRSARLPEVATPEIVELFAVLREQLDAPRCSLRWDAKMDGPRLEGLVRPIVALPRHLRKLPTDRLRLVLAHELVHLRRRDLWLGLAPGVAQALFFFHPLIHLTVREYRLAREAACDTEVLSEVRSGPREYGRLLLDLGVAERLAPLSAGVLTSRTDLYRRLTMLETCHHRRRRLPLLLALPILVAALIPFELVAGASTSPQDGSAPVDVAAVAGHAHVTSRAIIPPTQIASATSRSPSSTAFRPSASTTDVPASASSASQTSSSASTGSARSSSSWSSDEAFVLLLDEHSATFHGSRGDLEAARSHRRGGQQILWYRSENGEEWVIRDPEIVARAEELHAPVRELGRRQAELGERQAQLGSRQAELGSRQAKLGAEQAGLGKRQRELAAQINELTARDLELQARRLREEWNETLAEEREELEERRDELERQMRSLGASQRSLGGDQGELGARQSALGERQTALGAKQTELGAAQREASSRLEREIRELIKEAIATGDAERVRQGDGLAPTPDHS